jgi:hypothetical protein
LESYSKNAIFSILISFLLVAVTVVVVVVVVTSEKDKGKSNPVLAYIGRDGSRNLRLPGVSANRYMKMVVSLTHRPPLPSWKDFWYTFILQAESVPGPCCSRKD